MTGAWFIDHSTHEPVHVILPACPVCRSTARRCMRPSEHEAAEWHAERELLLSPLVGWPDWRPGVRCDDERCMDAASRYAGLLLGHAASAVALW